MKTSYEQAFKDHKYLWNISPAYDMTGAYVDSEDLDVLLASPTKATATRLLIRQIEYWFQAGTEDGGKSQVEDLLKEDSVIIEIYERYVN